MNITGNRYETSDLVCAAWIYAHGVDAEEVYVDPLSNGRRVVICFDDVAKAKELVTRLATGDDEMSIQQYCRAEGELKRLIYRTLNARN